MTSSNGSSDRYERLPPIRALVRKALAVIAASGLFLASGASPAWAAPGDLDPAFGGDGKVTSAFFAEANASATIYAIAVQSDGKIVAAGSASRSQTSGAGSGSEFALARYNADGSLDTGFSGDGKVTQDIAGGQDYAYAVAVQADGKIVAAGSANLNAASHYTRFTLVRYNADGSLDSGFGTAGIVSTDFFGTENVATSVVIQPDGRIVVAGNAHDGIGRRFALARYNADGSLDASFGSGGKVTTSFFGFDDGANALALQPDGRLVAVGSAYPGGANNQFAVARYNADGSLDASFGGGGKATTDFFGRNDIGHAVVLQADGRIVAAGLAYPVGSGTDEYALARYNPDGSLDSTFDGDGKATAQFSSAYIRRLSAAGQPDGKIVAASWGVDGATGFDVFALARFATDGSLDPSFGVGGRVTTSMLGSQNQAFATAVQPDGKIVAAGSAYDLAGFYSVFALARYSADGTPAPAGTLSGLSINPASVAGGTSAAGTVTLSGAAPAGGVLVTLSDDSPAIGIPASVTVPAGATGASFTITTAAVTAATSGTITGAAGGVTASALLTVTPAPPPTPAAPILLSPASAATVSQPVTLDWNDVTHAASYEVQVDTTSTIAAPFAAHATVLPSQLSLSGLPAQRLWWRVRAFNSAGVAGPFSATRRFTPQAPPAAASLSSLSVSPTSVTGGIAATGTVTLSSAAPPGGLLVTLNDDSAATTVPASVTVATGATSASFTVTTATVTATTVATITAASGGITRATSLTVTPAAAGATLTVTATGRGGESVSSSPAGINAPVGTTRAASFAVNTAITMSVSNGREAIWSGACSSGGNKARTCTFTLTGNASVTGNVQ